MQSSIRSRALSVMEFIKWIMTSIYDDEDMKNDDWSEVDNEEDYDYCADGCRFY